MRKIKTKESVNEILDRIVREKKHEVTAWQLERIVALINDFNSYGNASYLNCPLFPNSKFSTKDVFDLFEIKLVKA